ncbi:UDP-glucose 4-epimerase [Sphingomonas zeicaulis]|uniref:UDP-glucose 4-epimerase GalE n=1 Tax=Sphingomonas zeicaulis TaxID=1632740 RepID=UPI003D23D42A
MPAPRILVTGGAGYIGAHTAMRLAEAGFLPVVFDDLTNGHPEFVQWGPLEQGDVRDSLRLDAVLAEHRPVAIMHFAGLIEVSESVRAPQRFYDVNVRGALALAGAARRAGIDKFIFSSTCATYGEPMMLPMTEDHSQNPLNPYGHSKLLVERALGELCAEQQMRVVCLRYFNAAGADTQGRIGESHRCESHAIPLALRSVHRGAESFPIYGTDYATRDGTAERDYVHVVDLADAHVLALEHLLQGGCGGSFNVGTGTGTTVHELVAEIERISGHRCRTRLESRRAGDAAALVANAERARSVLGWRPRFGLTEIVASAWRWHCMRRDDQVDRSSTETVEARRSAKVIPIFGSRSPAFSTPIPDLRD